MTQVDATLERNRSGAGMAPARTMAPGQPSPRPPGAITFPSLPTPPSVNALYRNLPGRGRTMTRLYKDWRGHAGWRLREQAPTPVPGRVLIVVNIERTNDLADVDNRIKALFDLLVEHRVIEDDRHVDAFATSWRPSANGLVQLAIMPAAPLALQFQLGSDGRAAGWFLSAPQSEQEPA